MIQTVWMGLFAVALVACGKAADQGNAGSGSATAKPTAADPCATTCIDDGKCHGAAGTQYVENVGGRQEIRSAGAGICEATSAEDCKRSKNCAKRGLCTLEKADCLAASEEDCKASQDCKQAGLCAVSPDHYLCVPKNDSDCAASAECKDRGHCTAQRNSRGEIEACGPAAEADCKKAPACAAKGECSMYTAPRGPKQCGATKDAECAASAACKTSGACKVVPGAYICR